jgi:hypothetical protein
MNTAWIRASANTIAGAAQCGVKLPTALPVSKHWGIALRAGDSISLIVAGSWSGSFYPIRARTSPSSATWPQHWRPGARLRSGSTSARSIRRKHRAQDRGLSGRRFRSADSLAGLGRLQVGEGRMDGRLLGATGKPRARMALCVVVV